MNNPTKRKAPHLSGEDEYQDIVPDSDARSTKKGRQECAPSDEGRHNLPATTRYLPLVAGGSHWRGQMSLENAVIFGDSFSKSYEEDDDQRPNTWIYHVQGRQSNPSMRIHNFAFPGATAEEDLSNQFSCFKSVSPDLALKRESTTYFLSLGINDCGRTSSDELEPIVEAIFDTLHDLYVKVGARNFVLIDVPPINRSPGATESGFAENIEERVEAWNALLRNQAKDFARGGEQATVLLFSSHQVLAEVLDEPLDFDFAEDDPEIGGAGIWIDDLHLAPAVHAIFAERLLESLTKP